MVKQGKFAQVQQVKHQKNHVKCQLVKNGQLIAPNQIAEFLTVRYHLTNQQKTTPVVAETMLRFLNILIDQFGTQTIWSLESGLEQSLKIIGNQVPWQFYYVLSLQKQTLIKFLKREGPAVPLEHRLIVTDLETAVFDQILARHLALNWFAEQYRADPEKLKQVQLMQINQLQKSFIQKEGLDWKSIQVLYLEQVVVGDMDSVDSQTHSWIGALQKIKINF
ncbi:hypothetical protein G7084_08045 [Weissella coleopterorum]|uniref:Uncharacterized protein n=1 Tax=Weissella coleopterorum TaxID=2714949 RepID=A0A6G8B1V7_9LACO|nr:hypothetical protein [Weissella coleopterorum]QIL51236.1 hypothetical protein G7084_08045 [Weissella coleopterorum]